MSFVYRNSAAVGPYYDICCELGFPQCDIVKYPDGEWAVIQYENAPLLPSHTKWRVIASGLRNKEINHGIVSKLILESDPLRQRLWEREEAATRKVEDDHKRAQANRELMCEEAAKIMVRNDSLMQRVAKNGIGELDLGKIAQNVNPEKLAKRLPKC